eukprot:2914126-Lingulodinium_polyedra.AAC.1
MRWPCAGHALAMLGHALAMRWPCAGHALAMRLRCCTIRGDGGALLRLAGGVPKDSGASGGDRGGH